MAIKLIYGVKNENNICHQNLDDAPDVPVFYGRTKELEDLEQWIIKDKCKLVAIIGMRGIGKTNLVLGGIGKTDLSLKLAKHIKDNFQYLIWRSLLNAPRLEEILRDLIQFLSDNKKIDLPNKPEQQISLLLDSLRSRRCLVILDNAESILQGGEISGQYRSGYEGYGQLLERVGKESHKSCLLLTSREKPQDIEVLESPTGSVRVLPLSGLKLLDGQKIFTAIGSFDGSENDWNQIITDYDGNPLALELVAKHIKAIYNGNIRAFLQQHNRTIRSIEDLLKWYFEERLNESEKEIMYWLAINREYCLLSELKTDTLFSKNQQEIPDTIESLERRLPLEKAGTRFSLQPVIMEYMTKQLVEIICEEIKTDKIKIFKTHALIKAQAKDYVRDFQIRLILDPVSKLTEEINVENQLKQILSNLRKLPGAKGYAAGNILNLLGYLKSDLNGYDFSNLPVWQADLRNAKLYDVNFANADFQNSVFAETIGNILSVAFSSDGKIFATGDSKHELRLWEMPDGKEIQVIKHPQWVWSVAFSPNGEFLASACTDLKVRLYRKSSNSNLFESHKTLSGHTNQVRSVVFSADSEILASGSADQNVMLWSVNTGECLKTLKVTDEPGKAVRSVVFHPDGKRLVDW